MDYTTQMVRFASILSLILLFTGCSKDEAFTEITGTVYQSGTNKSTVVPNALVQFQWRIPKTFGAEIYHLDSVRTDANGSYEFGLDAPEENLHVFASGVQYFPGGALTMKANVIRGMRQTKDLEIVPYAWIKMNITKTGQHNNMSINSIAGLGGGYQVISDTLIISNPVYGNTEVEINMFKYRNGLQETEQVLVQTIALDTVTVNLSF